MKYLTRLLAGALLLSGSAAVMAATGGGATIHNAATLTFSGGQVTSSVDVAVETIGSAPTFTVSGNQSANPSQTASLTYTITSTSNGSDVYGLAVNSTDTDVGAPANLQITPPTITLGASITSRPSDASGNVFIAAGSENNLDVGDRVRITIGGTDFVYEITSLTPGTPAFTVGNTTTPEVPTAFQVTAVTPGAPPISAPNVPAGVQIGEVGTFVVDVTAGTPTTPGTDGSHEITISGNTSATGPGGVPVPFSDTLAGTVTVLSGEATLVKDVRNVTTGGGFATSGVSARTGDVLEYRLTAGTVPGNAVTGAQLEDFLPEFTSYVANSTTLNGNPVADAGGTPFPLDEGGLPINSPTGVAGEIVDGETAVILFQVTVD